MLKKTSVLALLLGLLATGPALAADGPEGKRLTGAELHALLDAGAVLDFTSADKRVLGAVAFLRDGPAYVLWGTRDGAGGNDQGTWSVEGDALCLTWKLLAVGRKSCVHYYRVGDGRFDSHRVSDGVLRNHMVLRR